MTWLEFGGHRSPHKTCLVIILQHGESDKIPYPCLTG